MKVAVVVLALVGLAFSAPQPRKLFHEHFEDFLDVLFEETGAEIDLLMEDYLEYGEFLVSVEYIGSLNFKELVSEMQSLPEFKSVVEFLENRNIDITFFIDFFNNVVESFDIKRKARYMTSRRDLTVYLNEIISMFPKERLSALFDQKMAEDDEFREAIETLRGEEWDRVFTAFWESEMFQAELKTLNDHGIDLTLVVTEILALFGQN